MGQSVANLSFWAANGIFLCYGGFYFLCIIGITVIAAIDLISILKKHTKRNSNQLLKKETKCQPIVHKLALQTNTECNKKAECKYECHPEIKTNNSLFSSTPFGNAAEKKYESESEEDQNMDQTTIEMSEEENNRTSYISLEIEQWLIEKKIDLDSFSGKFKYIFLSISSKRSMYFDILVHVFDTATDIGVLIDWYELAQNEENSNLQGIDMYQLFYLSIAAIILYRCVSSFILYLMTRSWKKVLLQMLDLELFETILLNWKLNMRNPCDPQILLQKLEAVLESAPQSVLQIIFLWKLKQFNILVIISLIFSLFSLSSRFTPDDNKLFNKRSAELNCKCKQFTAGLKKWAFVYSPAKRKLCLCCISWYYIRRRVWRVGDITVRIFILSLIWVSVGGYFLSFYIAFEFFFFLYLSIKFNKFEILMGLVGSIIINDIHFIQKYFVVYRFICNLLLLTFCTYFLCYDVCVFPIECPDFHFRRSLVFESEFGLAVYLYIWLMNVLCAVFFWYMFKDLVKNQTAERDLKSLIISGDSDKFSELVAFGMKIDFNLKVICIVKTVHFYIVFLYK